MSLLQDAYDYVAGELTTAGLNVVTDPRNLQPPCVILDPPAIRAISGNIITADVRVTILTPPPGNRDALLKLLADADTVVAAVEVVDGQPGTYPYGERDLPAYTLTVRVTLIRTP
jgi:hypothetical protein